MLDRVLAARCLLLVVAGLGCAVPAAAEETKPVGLEYLADPGCPTRSSFVTQVSARTALVELVESRPDLPRVAIQLRETADGATGTVQVGSDPPRIVSDTSCVDVAAALALISALALDPAASTDPVPKATEDRATFSRRATSGNQPLKRGPQRPPAPSASGGLPPTTSADSDRGARHLQVASWEPQATATATRGFSADSILWLGARAGAMANVRLGQSPIGRIGVEAVFSRSPHVTPALGSAAFQLLGGRLNGCAPDLTRGRVSVIPCLSAELGGLSAYGETGRGVIASHSVHRTWIAAAESLSVVLLLKEPYYLTISAELREPLRRYEFIFEAPTTHVATVPRLEIGGALGAGLRL